MILRSSASDLASRFEGTPGRATLVEALSKQALFESNMALIEEVASTGTLCAYEPQSHVIRQDGTDSDIYFILVGSVVVSPNGRPDVRRGPGTHVGELATIDPTVRRSADVVSETQCVALRLSEFAFTSLSTRFPFLWRNIAKELGDRLRTRALMVKARNVTSRIFIGSSSEALSDAKELHTELLKSPCDVTLWARDIFAPGEHTMESLEQEAKRVDFAALILSPDDRVFSRWSIYRAPRDNLIFELGLFMGAIGRERSFLMIPKGRSLKLPSDLNGITHLRYASSNIAEAASTLQTQIEKLGPK